MKPDHKPRNQNNWQWRRDTNGVYVVPAFVGLGAPTGHVPRGVIVGLTRGNQTGQPRRPRYARIDCLQDARRPGGDEDDSGIKLKMLKVDAGAVANDVSCIPSDILGVPGGSPLDH